MALCMDTAGHLGIELCLLLRPPRMGDPDAQLQGGAGIVGWAAGGRGLHLALLYSVHWNLFNVSLVWTDSHAPHRRGPGTRSSN